MKKYKTPTAIILTIALIIGFITIPTTTATQHDFTVNTDNATIVGFGGKQWAVIGHDSVGDNTPSDTLTLLLANVPGNAYDTSAFRTGSSSEFDNSTRHTDNWWYADNPSGMNWNEPREYLGSTLQQQMETIANELKTSSPKEEALIVPCHFWGGGISSDLVRVAGPDIVNARLWALSSGEALMVTNSLRGFPSWWWLRSPGSVDWYAVTVTSDGGVSASGSVVRNTGGGGVRPALQLNLQSVLFTSDNSATDGKSAAIVDNGFVELIKSNNIKFTMLHDSLELASVTPTNRVGNVITFDYNGATPNKLLSAVVMRDGEVAYYGKLVESTSENGSGVELTLPGDFDTDTDTIQVFVEEANGVNQTDFASAFVELGDPCDYGVHVHDEQTDLTKAVYCKVCGFEVFPELPAIEVDIVNGKVQIRNNTNGFFSTKGYYLTDGTNEWALPVVVVRSRSAVVIGGGKRGLDLSGVDEVWLVEV
ncbi:MAG: hypothetical protein FWH07_04175 [Oscillospiraceae bacterium]|nr:hypothetical protein [Oscillospiraceae bacterium]